MDELSMHEMLKTDEIKWKTEQIREKKGKWWGLEGNKKGGGGRGEEKNKNKGGGGEKKEWGKNPKLRKLAHALV